MLGTSLPNVASALEWLYRRVARDAKIVLTDLTDYEVRRELDRLGATKKLGHLERHRDESFRVGVSHEAWVKAAEFWAITGREGTPTRTPWTATRSWPGSRRRSVLPAMW